MSQHWHYAKGSEKHGPITAAQLKELATTGQLAPDDLVWREDMQEWRKASTVKGLFPEQTTQSPPRQPTPTATSHATGGEDIALWEKPAIIALLVVCFFPVGLYLLWKNPRIPKGQKTLWTGAFCGLVVLGMVISSIQRQATEKALARAQALWDEGNNAEAVAIYQSIIDEQDMFLSDGQKALVYGRVIDHLAQNGKEDEVRAMLEKLNRTASIVTPLVESADGRRILASIEAEQRRVEEQETLAAAARNPITLDGPERADFLDNTANYKGKAIRFECEWIGGGMRNRTTGRMTALELEVYHGSGFFKMNLTVPTDLDIPNIQVGDDLVVTFLCEDGQLHTGNTALRIERRR